MLTTKLPFATLTFLLWACETYAQQPVVFQSPQHDVRVALDMSFPQHIFESFYGLYYGNTIRLGEFGCGDPKFLIHVNQEVELTAKGSLSAAGTYGSSLDLATGLNAKIYDTCFGMTTPSVGGFGHLGNNFGNVTSLTGLTLNGLFSISSLAYVLGISFPVQNTIQLPFSLSSIPIDLSQTPAGIVLDFVEPTNGHWEHTCPCQHKDIPITVNVGSFGQLGTFADGNSRGDSRLIIDGTVDNQRYLPFDTNTAQIEDFQSDNPVPFGSTATAPNIGVSVKDSFFGERSKSAQTGFLGALLPIRVTGQHDFKVLWWKKTIQYEVVLDGAAVSVTQDQNGTPIANVSLSSGYASIRSVKSKNGHLIVGPERFIKRVSANATFDRFGFDWNAKAIGFRVSDFGLKIKTSWFIFPIRLSAGQLEEALNHGMIDVAQLTKSFDVGLGPCLYTGYDKFKSSATSYCDPNHPTFQGQVIGSLSYEPEGEYGGGGVPPPSHTVSIDPTSLEIMRRPDAIHMRLRLVSQ